MKVTVATLSDTVFTLEVASDMEVENFKALCEVESGIPASEMLLLFNGQVLLMTKELLDIHSRSANAWGQEEFSRGWGGRRRHGDVGQVGQINYG